MLDSALLKWEIRSRRVRCVCVALQSTLSHTQRDTGNGLLRGSTSSRLAVASTLRLASSSVSLHKLGQCYYREDAGDHSSIVGAVRPCAPATLNRCDGGLVEKDKTTVLQYNVIRVLLNAATLLYSMLSCF